MSGDLVPWQKTVNGLLHKPRASGTSRPSDHDLLGKGQTGGQVRRDLQSHSHRHLRPLHLLRIGILAYGVFSAEELAPFIKNPDSFVPFVATSLLPPGFDAIILLAAISAAMSTISAIVLVTTTSLTADTPQVLRPEIPDDRVLVLTRVVGVLIIAVSARWPGTSRS